MDEIERGLGIQWREREDREENEGEKAMGGMEKETEVR
jgi:hypothetical protein